MTLTFSVMVIVKL